MSALLLICYTSTEAAITSGNMLFTMNTTNETTDGWDHLAEKVPKIALCTLKINYTLNQR